MTADPPARPVDAARRALVLALAALLAVALAWLAWIAAHIGWYRYQPPRETAFMAQRHRRGAREEPEGDSLQYRWVPYARISVQAEARDDRRRGREVRRAWRLRLGRHPERAREEPEEGPRRRRRLDDHAAAREEPVPLAGEELLAQGGGGGRHRAARSDAAEAAHPRALPQRDRVGQRRIRRRGRRAALLRRVAPRSFPPSRRRDSRRWRPARASSSATGFGLSRRPRRDDPRAHARGGGPVP